MILQALKEYYDRKEDLPRQGWELKAFPFLLQINADGSFFGFRDTREGEGKNRFAKEYLVPALGEKKGNGIKANFFWENIEYLLGIPVPTKSKPRPNLERVTEQHKAFIAKINSISGDCDVLDSVRCFLRNFDSIEIRQSPLWTEVVSLNQALLIEIVNQGVVTDDQEIKNLIEKQRQNAQGTDGLCLVSGESDEISSLEPPIRGVQGANPTGASLVSVNNKITNGGNGGAVPAFSSFMKEQGHNSPIGKRASFAYTTALNHLMRRDSPQKLAVGDATTVFWSAKDTCFESEVSNFFNEPPKDDPDRGTRAVAGLLQSVKTGAYAETDKGNRFYVLGLSPNSARISVRIWKVGTVPEMAENFARHFEGLQICHGSKEREHLSLFRLLVSTASMGKPENIPPNLAGETMRTILDGLPYPQTLLQAVIRRVRAEQAKKDSKTGKSLPNVTYPRAALIKGYLNRLIRTNNPEQEEAIKVGLDKENKNIGYRLGRLFATLEKIQAESHPGINATIRDKFYGAASSSPVTVFGNLMRLKNHHLAKLESKGRRVNFERLIGEVASEIKDFPAHLKLEDQGRFAIGYYHQMNDFYTK